MEKEHLDIEYFIYDKLEELSTEEQLLINKAREASFNAYAPYSQFRVGAAVLLANNEIITANNQENASFPEGLCAERVALFYASANNKGQIIKSIAIAGNSENFETSYPITPCGACRQVMAEYENKYQYKINVLMTGISGKILKVIGINSLLPFQFTNKDFTK